MAAWGVFLSNTRHVRLAVPGFSLPSIVRSLSSAGRTAPVTPVSYPVKPQDPSTTEEESAPSAPPQRRVLDGGRPQQQRASGDAAEGGVPRAWTREEARYVRDVPKVSPVSYPTRVAPLPEYRPSESKEEGEESGSKGGEDALEKEARTIETFTSILGKLEGQEEAEKVPFPKIIRRERQPGKVVLDLHKAIKEVKANAKRNFPETVEAHVGLGVNPKRSDQTVRGAVTLPHGTGKVVRVAVFADGAEADEARAAGADVVGGDELVEEIRKGGGKLNFDKCISTPTFMPHLGKIARILGPRGLMPNPKLGSVTRDISKAVKEAKRGRADFKMDKTAIIHLGIGKVDFSEEALRDNIGAFINALLVAKPAGLKKTSKYAGYVNSFSLCSTMGPGYPVSIQSLSEAADLYNKLHPKSAA